MGHHWVTASQVGTWPRRGGLQVRVEGYRYELDGYSYEWKVIGTRGWLQDGYRYEVEGYRYEMEGYRMAIATR